MILDELKKAKENSPGGLMVCGSKLDLRFSQYEPTIPMRKQYRASVLIMKTPEGWKVYKSRYIGTIEPNTYLPNTPEIEDFLKKEIVKTALRSLELRNG